MIIASSNVPRNGLPALLESSINCHEITANAQVMPVLPTVKNSRWNCLVMTSRLSFLPISRSYIVLPFQFRLENHESRIRSIFAFRDIMKNNTAYPFPNGVLPLCDSPMIPLGSAVQFPKMIHTKKNRHSIDKNSKNVRILETVSILFIWLTRLVLHLLTGNPPIA